MGKNETMERFHRLYDEALESRDGGKMKTLGRIFKEAVSRLCDADADSAKELVEKLGVIEWRNYLTAHEADVIVNGMRPTARWTEESVMRGLSQLGYDGEEKPCYNSHSLYAAISMVYSDSGKTLAELVWKKSPGDVDDFAMLKMCYRLAIDKLKDEDGMFDIRKYFCVDDGDAF